MSGEEIKAKVAKWSDEIGIRKARVELQNAGLGFSTADKLCKGEYESTPTRDSIEKIKLALGNYLEAS